MSDTKWVQHISGHGEKWEVINLHENDVAYRVKGKRLDVHPKLDHYLPRSEYIPCDPPEVWEDVTAECWHFSGTSLVHRNGCNIGDCFVGAEAGYRLRKVDLIEQIGTDPLALDSYKKKSAFIVERKTS